MSFIQRKFLHPFCLMYHDVTRGVNKKIYTYVNKKSKPLSLPLFYISFINTIVFILIPISKFRCITLFCIQTFTYLLFSTNLLNYSYLSIYLFLTYQFAYFYLFIHLSFTHLSTLFLPLNMPVFCLPICLLSICRAANFLSIYFVF